MKRHASAVAVIPSAARNLLFRPVLRTITKSRSLVPRDDSLPGLWILSALILAAPAKAQSFLHAPVVNEYARHDPAGTTILPTGRLLRPAGRAMPVAKWPHGMAMSPDGSTLFVASAGVGQLITGWRNEAPQVRVVQPGESGRRSNGGAAVFAPDGHTFYWTSGDSGAVYVVDVDAGLVTGTISLNAGDWSESYAMDLALSADGRWLYCADVTNFRLAVVDLAQKRVAASVRVGRYPYALTLSGSRVYVANIGLFQYSPIPPPTPSAQLQAPNAKPPDPRGLTFPPFGFPSKQARDGVEVEGRRVPGLGDPNVPDSFSVWCVDVSDPTRPRVVSKIKTGLLVGKPSDGGKTIGGSAPNFLLARGDALYVSNENNDLIERLDLRENRVAARMRIAPSPLVARLRGVSPCGLALSPDGKRLYVAEWGLNALAVLDATSLKVLGQMPTAWYPYRVAVSPDGGALSCICFRGFGNGPNAGKNVPSSPYLGMRGSLHVIPTPADNELPALTARVLENNGITDASADRPSMSWPFALPRYPAAPSPDLTPSPIKYVVFITKENHTYDTIFDRVPGANDDPSLLRWGLNQRIAATGQRTLNGAAVMTNHNALARQFTVSDNFYMEPEASGVGHRWLVGVQPNNFCQMTYTLGWRFNAASKAPGRLASFGSNGSIAPEDYPEAGSMWEHLASHGVRFRNYGEGFEFAGVNEGAGEQPTGAREVINMPMSKVLFDNTCREYPIFNMNIPDQYRADWFIKDFNRLKGMPPFVNIAICNDHGADPAPQHGYPYKASWMADNDLALGRIVEFLSHTSYWKNMAIFVTQDDAGGEPDHVDAQRSVMLVISPWAKRGYVSHRLTTIVSMHRTLYELLGLPPLNLFDALANDFSDCFTATPDLTPYTHTPVDSRIFDPAKAHDPADPDYRRARMQPSPRRDDPDEPEDVLRRTIGTGGR